MISIATAAVIAGGIAACALAVGFVVGWFIATLHAQDLRDGHP